MRRVVAASFLVAISIGCGVLAPGGVRAGQPPLVSNVVAQQRPFTRLVDVSYDLEDVDSGGLFVWLLFSPDAGATWTRACLGVTGDVGPSVTPGLHRQATWNAGADAPGVVIPACRLRVVADDEPPPPALLNLRRLANARADTFAFAPMDTIPYGRAFGFVWSGYSPTVAIYPPQVLAQMDSVPPLDGLLGYEFGSTFAACSGSPGECWQPRRFVEITGDSVPFFRPSSSLWFFNDDSSASFFRQRLPSGVHTLRLNAVDVAGAELPESKRSIPFVVNHDPQTTILDGVTDVSHQDPQAYPYYIQLNDPGQVRHPFHSGDRIPDRTYVVVKALGRDDPRDLRVRPGFPLGFTGSLVGVRTNFAGGALPFTTQASALDTLPAWGVDAGGWYGETLGFLTGPRTQYTISLRAVDEHGRSDGTPASLSFEVGYQPCLQCIELLPRPSSSTPQFGADVPCVESADPAWLAGHPCLAGVTDLRVSAANVADPDPTRDLEPIAGAGYLLVHRVTYGTSFRAATPSRVDSLANYVLPANRFKLGVVLHGRDDDREAWSAPARRIGGIMYQVSNACDPGNQIRDGVGPDNIAVPTWGQPANGVGLDISPVTGLWTLSVEVYVPTLLLQLGEANFRVIVGAIYTGGDTYIAEQIVRACTRQFGDGWVDAVILDQTMCNTPPYRPATYNVFGGVRPSGALTAGQTWRDCNLTLPQILYRLSLEAGAMASLGGQPVRKYFRLTLHPGTGADLVCAP